jgi:hypothetical protein
VKADGEDAHRSAVGVIRRVDDQLIACACPQTAHGREGVEGLENLFGRVVRQLSVPEKGAEPATGAKVGAIATFG